MAQFLGGLHPFVIITAPDGRYVQAAIADEVTKRSWSFGLLCEAVSNRFLPPEGRLEPALEGLLRGYGWEETEANWQRRINIAAVSDLQRASSLMTDTLTSVFRCAEGDEVEIHLERASMTADAIGSKSLRQLVADICQFRLEMEAARRKEDSKAPTDQGDLDLLRVGKHDFVPRGTRGRPPAYPPPEGDAPGSSSPGDSGTGSTIPHNPGASVDVAQSPDSEARQAEIRTENGFAIHRGDERDVSVAQTPARVSGVRATAYTYRLEHPDAAMELRLVWAANGERWVEARDIETPWAMLLRIDGRLRLTIETVQPGIAACALRLARPKADGWSNLGDASLSELTRASGTPIGLELRRAGARDVGSRSAVLDETGRSRNRLIATFDDENEAVPVLAFVLTRVAPLVREARLRSGKRI
jgi:hypothetical protein